jgi:phospholipase C
MMENHSFDDHLGMLGRGDGLTLGHDGQPVNYNPDPAGGYIRSFHLPNTSNPSSTGPGITQSWDASHTCWDHGTNMGFVAGCTPAAMGYWDETDLPFYYGMARQFPIGDRYFCSVMAQTFPNRKFLVAATALGDVSTDFNQVTIGDAPNGTIFDRLNAHGITWKDYYPDIPTAALFLAIPPRNPKSMVNDVNQFLADAKAGRLPAFSIVDPYTNYSEEGGDISIGEAFAARIVNAVLESPTWEKTVLIWTYDEHGGYFDHVPPVPAVKPDRVPPRIEVPPDLPGQYDYTGFRVPCCVVSPWAKRDYVSHVIYDHTSILKFLETKWNLPALTYRDANAHNMLDFFDFKAPRPPFAEPPVLPAPKNPFVGPLPANSSSPGFHPISQPVPDASLPPARYRTRTKPRDADELIAAHTAAALGHPQSQPARRGGGGGSDVATIAGGSAGGAAVLAAGAGALVWRHNRKAKAQPGEPVA